MLMLTLSLSLSLSLTSHPMLALVLTPHSHSPKSLALALTRKHQRTLMLTDGGWPWTHRRRAHHRARLRTVDDERYDVVVVAGRERMTVRPAYRMTVDQRLREQELEGLRRVVQMVGPGGSCGRSVWCFISVVLQWRLRVDLQWILWRRSLSFYRGQWHSLLCLVDKPYRYQWKARRWQATAAMQWRYDNVDQGVRRTV
jgi:hypothetical protein